MDVRPRMLRFRQHSIPVFSMNHAPAAGNDNRMAAARSKRPAEVCRAGALLLGRGNGAAGCQPATGRP